jgi:hypothetical protein
MMNKPCEKKPFATQRLALDALGNVRRHKMHRRDRQGGHGLRQISVYYCEEHGAWHLGRAGAEYKNHQTAPKLAAPKIPTMGELRRKFRKLEQQMDRERKHRAFLIGKIVEADLAQQRLDREMRDAQDAVLKEMGYL